MLSLKSVANRLFSLAILFILIGCPQKEQTWNPANGDACVSCHINIEQAHGPIEANECTRCHGGNETALSKEEAHVPIPSNYADVRGDSLPPAPDGYIKDMPPDMLDALDVDYIRFINPGDIRAAEVSCGGACHAGMVEAVKNSVMTTNVGHYWLTRYYAGLQDHTPIYGSIPVEDHGWSAEEGTVAALETLSPPTDEEFDAATTTEELEKVAIDHYLAKNCNTCHASGYPRNNSRATYRSTGCSSCHVLYDISGVYQGNDEAMPKNVPVYPARHEITSDITVEQCATCHYQGGRIGLLFRGIREGGFSETPPHADLWNDSVYTHVPGYYILDEDNRNNVDETPADIHYQAGMVCVDCHVGSDVHGTGRISTSSKTQVDLRCEDCHGDSRQKATPDSEGVFHTSSGRPLPQLFTTEDGNVALIGRVDKQQHVIPQPSAILQTQPEGSFMHQGMGIDDNGWSHTDSLTCDSCHSSWTQQCLGCHVNLDMRLQQVDYQTGTKSSGLTSGKRDWYDLDTVILCQSPSGKIQSCQSSQQTQISVVDRDGNLVLGEKELDENGEPTGNYNGVFRSRDELDGIIGWSNFFQHTTSRTPRSCNSCHRNDDSAEELTRVKGVYGHGTGEYMLQGPYGEVDALQFIDENGELTTSFAHPGTGPVPEEARNNALDVILSD